MITMENLENQEDVQVVKYTYIKLDIKGRYVTFSTKFNEELYNNIGETYEDYLNNKWVLLSDEQVAFHEEHPSATVEEVWNMELKPVVERTLADAKREMLMNIENYDNGENVNDFTINDMIHAWFTPAERGNYANSINAAKLLGKETLIFAVGENVLQVKTEDAEKMLAAIQLYADECYMVTKQHQMEIESLSTIEDVDNFDYTKGYPEKLNFNLE